MRSTATITLTALALTLATSTLSYVINPSHAPSLNDTTALLPRADAIADCTVARTEVSSPIFNGWYNIHDARARCSAITAADCAAAAICKKDASGNLGLGFKDWKDCGSNEVSSPFSPFPCFSSRTVIDVCVSLRVPVAEVTWLGG